MQRASLVLLISLLAIVVFEIAALAALEAENPFIKASAVFAPFAGLVATVFFASGKDTWVVDLVRKVIGVLNSRAYLLYLSTICVFVSAIGFGQMAWVKMHTPPGTYTVEIIEEHDVPSERLAGIPVVVEQKLRPSTIEKKTDAAGIASFPVDFGDVFAVRIRKSDNAKAPVFIVRSDGQLSEKNKKIFELIRFSDIPAAAWIKERAVKSEQEDVMPLAQIPAEFFRFKPASTSANIIPVEPEAITFPFSLPPAETIINRRAFSIGFSPQLKLPRWVAYEIQLAKSESPRTPDSFLPDPALPASYQATSEDYRNNPYDRGTLIRRTDLLGLGEPATHQMYYLTTVVPQLDYVNRKTWFELEKYTSLLAADSRVFVIRGPMYQTKNGASLVNTLLMGPGLVPVPTDFFQILVVQGRPALRVEAHIIPNTYVPFATGDLPKFKVSIGAISKATGLTFDAKLLSAAN